MWSDGPAASRKNADLVGLLMQFNLNVAIVEQIVVNLRAKLAELKHNREEILRLRRKTSRPQRACFRPMRW